MTPFNYVKEHELHVELDCLPEGYIVICLLCPSFTMLVFKYIRTCICTSVQCHEETRH